MDRLDRKILRILQEDSTLAVADLAKKVGLSTTPCWRRIQRMEEEGVIRRRVALLDPVKVNTKVTVFVSIRTASHSIEWLKRFSEPLRKRAMPDSTLTGEANLLVFPNLDAANISLGIVRTMMDALHVGPILLGAALPAHILSTSVTSRGVVNMAALAVVEASQG